MKVLVSGGMGFIGSHTVVELINSGHEAVIVDNLYNSFKSVLTSLKEITGKDIPFYDVDVTNEKELEEVFEKEKVDAVIHFAGYKAVGESVSKPLMYYKNNLLTTINLAELSQKYNVKHFIFSSSATVYGDQESPLKESMRLGETTNPYGETKKMSERILTDFSKVNPDFHIVLLRYFNPIGAHESGLIGEVPQGIPNNLMPYITQVASGKREKLFVFGNDYDTKDGTGVRDYIHVVDLAKGHLAALTKSKSGLSVYNLGTGEGVSVLELIETFKRVNKIDIPYEITTRRAGDVASVYADGTKALKELGFKTKLTLEDMVRDSWNFEKNLK
ncbi:UDP-glucose 4-epimerase GalE [Haploplasma axanthum]|uniref:UDP-glucose 4-epimerase n=1 Tax=Haploplasma axanthum TaxID=29552 RepID=A0A449BC24_HAPAX|nr:UDP-glucose 4-epimerase GalE [Haploplasma axanthum]VEU79993.1 UDP-glucose 4-epimerase [Haploplasma axanthum]